MTKDKNDQSRSDSAATTKASDDDITAYGIVCPCDHGACFKPRCTSKTCIRAMEIEAAYKLGCSTLRREAIDSELIRKAVTAGLKAFRSQHGSLLSGSNLSSAAKRVSGEVLGVIPRLRAGTMQALSTEAVTPSVADTAPKANSQPVTHLRAQDGSR